jgi:SAM-dependent methyltransferase
LANQQNLVTLESNLEIAAQLKENRDANQLQFHIETSALSKRKLIQHETNLSKGNILDIGCGTGAFLNEMKSASWNITGLEPEKKASKIASKLYGINTQNPEVLFQLPKNSYDAITMWHVLEHVPDLNERIQELKNLLDNNGRLFVAVPNYTSGDAGRYGKYWAAYDVPRHLWHFSPKSIRTLFNKHGFVLERTLPMKLDSFYVSMLSEKYKNGSSRLFSAVWTGLKSNLAAGDDKWSSQIYVFKK